MVRQWTLNGQDGFNKCLSYEENAQKSSTLGEHEVLVELHAASLNYRDLAIADGSAGRSGPIRAGVVPGSDGAGVVKAIGASVSTVKPGDRVITHMTPRMVERSGDKELPVYLDIADGLGQVVDGTLRSEGVFSEATLVLAPKTLNWSEAATLTCSGLTAWNALFGLKGREAGPGKWVLVQGTGGVSIAALQLAVAAGSTVVATTSSEEKAKRLRDLGAKYTVNYRENPQDWGLKSRNFTPSQQGFDIVVDIGGDGTLAQSVTAVRTDGVVVTAGLVGGQAEPVPMLTALGRPCIVRGVLLGSRSQFREMVRFIDDKNIKPAVDDVAFELAEVKDAYSRLKAQKHFSKIVIKIDH
ncbi:putative alcohol dehydrogenase [Colletotrichum somersetense]|nr:putative alcohol dehydrogenase [Colletotrichum somersetense]